MLPIILVSRCLLGDRVRYDGQHQKNQMLVDVFSRDFQLFPFCPEVEIGLSVPRPPIQLVNVLGRIKALDRKTHTQDVTPALKKVINKIDLSAVVGAVLQEKSPSCGLEGVKVLAFGAPEGKPSHVGQGVFAQSLRHRLPDLPVVESKTLYSAHGRETFRVAIDAYIHRLKE